ncbi:hypothetical protein RRU01S_03_02790 [Agrobacterium rubi TR3 = NBRC 13261]|uniref:Uncharacterized protein n=1 Tax=Agrobacterium rubi TR3 = NBRC 13261 TaxID=1368415 RepID=A0A081CR11_9HYPH|nr:hypothetical protein RRU01S_03_02790 [Agrobacterium rubi TR3 = NBRC 13261]
MEEIARFQSGCNLEIGADELITLAFNPSLYYSARIRVDTLGGNAGETGFDKPSPVRSGTPERTLQTT